MTAPESQHSLTEEAVAIIGRNGPFDWRLSPRAHAQDLGPVAGALRRVLEHDTLLAYINRYEMADAEALAWQVRYKNLSFFSLAMNAAACLAGGFVMLPAAPWVMEAAALVGLTMSEYVATSILMSIQLALIAAAFISALRLSRMDGFEKWNRARGEAELARVELFQKVMQADEPVRDGEMPLLPLQLEYYRRYMLDSQLAYYTARGAKFELTQDVREFRGWIFNLAGVPLTVVVIAAWFGGDELFFSATAALASFIGMFASTFSSLDSSLKLLHQDERNAGRYETTAANLKFLRDSYLDSARTAAVQGNRDGILSFVAAVDEQIAAEHRDWALLQRMAQLPSFDQISAVKLPKLPRRIVKLSLPVK